MDVEQRDHFKRNLWTAIREYYYWFGESHVKLIRWIRDSSGIPMLILVRIKDQQGNPLSCFLHVEEDNRVDYGYRITEDTVCSPENEEKTATALQNEWL